MLLSTLPDLPGRTYDVKGVVYDHALLSDAITVKNRYEKNPTFLLERFNSITQQASDMGADAIIDIKITFRERVFVIIGTAVKLK